MEINEQIQEKLALLKSSFLSEIIIFSGPGDFDFTEYLRFDHQIEDTLVNPDEVWSFDEEVDVYRKYYSENGESYSQLVLVLKETKDNPLLIILNFVTRFDSLAEKFCKGVRKAISTRH